MRVHFDAMVSPRYLHTGLFSMKAELRENVCDDSHVLLSALIFIRIVFDALITN